MHSKYFKCQRGVFEENIFTIDYICSKQKRENLGVRNFKGGYMLAVGPTAALSKGGRRELKADYVLDNWDNYKLREHTFLRSWINA